MYTSNPWQTPPQLYQCLKRSVPGKYDGYVLDDLWIAPGANVGWSLFIGQITMAALNKINALADMLFKLTNGTTVTLPSLNEVINRLEKL